MADCARQFADRPASLVMAAPTARGAFFYSNLGIQNMTREVRSLREGGETHVPNPWPALITGLASAALAALATPAGETLLHVRLVLLGTALLAAGKAVSLSPRSALMLSLAALVTSVAAWGMNAGWDTALLVVHLLTVMAGVAAVLVLLPPVVGRAAVSLMIVFHFVGILTAVTSVPPPGGPAPWLTRQLWTCYYRPYLQFLYLNNAYHFYSPEPGPATLLWFRVYYTDGSSRWVKVPNRQEDAKDPMALEYYRRLSVTENVNQLAATMVMPADVLERRLLGGALLGIPTPEEIAAHMPAVLQHRVPVEYARQLLQSYARFVAGRHPHPNPAVGVTGVKVYRVVHGLVAPGAFAAGLDPADPTLYSPYYQGEFDRDGNLKDPADPFLYWLIPILKAKAPGSSGEGEVLNYVGVHSAPRHGKEER
jgi:hypothetical protein